MKPRVVTMLSAVLLSAVVAASEPRVSGQSGVYAVVEKVVFEPPTGLPDRIQIWGAFAVMERIGERFTAYVYRKPERGYMYFQLPSIRQDEIQNARREWNDLKSVAGTKQAVAFGYWDNYKGDKMPAVRNAEVSPDRPDAYRTEMGLTKLNAGMPGGTVEALLKLVEGR